MRSLDLEQPTPTSRPEGGTARGRAAERHWSHALRDFRPARCAAVLNSVTVMYVAENQRGPPVPLRRAATRRVLAQLNGRSGFADCKAGSMHDEWPGVEGLQSLPWRLGLVLKC